MGRSAGSTCGQQLSQERLPADAQLLKNGSDPIMTFRPVLIEILLTIRKMHIFCGAPLL
jgi:hypothetical protein